MLSAALVGLTLLITPANPQAAPAQVEFRNPAFGLSFRHPANWTVRRNQSDARITFTVADNKPVLLEVFSVGFSGTQESWQELQIQVNQQLKNEVVRQWVEEVLAVPMLLTQIRTTVGGESRTVLTGLFYANTPSKMLFRLSASPEAYDEALFLWRRSLETLRTLGNDMPQAQQPQTTPPAATPGTPTPPRTPRPDPVTALPGRNEGPVRKENGTLNVRVANRDLVLRFPDAWTAELQGTTVTLRRTGLAIPVKVEVASTLDSPAPAVLIRNRSRDGLAAFTRVDRREERVTRRNRAGADVAWYWRFGVDAAGPRNVGEGYGLINEWYWFLSVELVGSPMPPAARRQIEDLMERMSLEPAG